MWADTPNPVKCRLFLADVARRVESVSYSVLSLRLVHLMTLVLKFV